MKNDRISPRGIAGFKYSVRRFLGTQLGNMIKAAIIRRKYGLNKTLRFSGYTKHKFNIAVVAIFKGEDEYLREWVEFHRLVGVEHFFLYDNGASTASRAILEPYITDGLVSYIPFAEFPEKSMRNRYGKDQFRKLSMQNLAYGDCARMYSKYCSWIIKIDLDEFIYPLKPFNTLPEAFKQFDKPGIRGFSVRAWRFGPSGEKVRTGLPVIETYTRRNPEPDKNWKVVGRGSRISRLSGYHSAHTWFYKHISYTHHLYDTETSDYVHINHYYIKSEEEYLDKIKRHSTGHKAGKESPDKWPVSDAQANKKDEGDILRFLPELKKRLSDSSNVGRDE